MTFGKPPVPGQSAEPGSGTRQAPTFTPWTDAVIEAMDVYGGSFVKALARAYLAADIDNRLRILEVWDPIYGSQYREQAKRMRAQENDGGADVAVQHHG